MSGSIFGFVLWSIIGCFFIVLGIYSFFSKTTMGFWANAKVFEVNNVKKYNSAVGKLFCVFGVVFILLGLPLLSEQSSVWILFSSIGVMIEVITVMVIYTTVIERKYKK